jgi:hypothetical protein
MASTYSSNLKIELMSTGENSGTWGDITNTNLGTTLEQAVIGLGNPDFTSDANLTITLTNSSAAQAARALVLNVTSVFGSLTATRELVVPTIQKQYIVQNNTTGGQSITVKTSAGTGITVPNGRKAHLYVDGTNVIQMFDFVDINGGSIDGTAIGASSASTGAFTTLNASGATTLDGNVTLGNASGDTVTVTGTIASNLLFTDNTYDIGASGATRPRNLYLAGAATIGGNLSVGGTLTLTGGVNLNGNVTVGDSAADTLTINSTVTSNLIFTDNTYDIGASGATRPRNLFIAGNITAGGNQTLTGSLTVDSTTDSSSTTTGSIQTDGGVGVAKALYVGTTANIAGAVTLSGGTANGVAYLNGSKVLTSGSALTFDGTSNLALTGTASTSLITSTTSTTTGAYAGYKGSGDPTIQIGQFSASNAGTTFGLSNSNLSFIYTTTYASTPASALLIGTAGATPLVFATSGVEAIRVDISRNVGIGTSSPGEKLDVVGGIRALTASTSANTLRVGNTGNSTFLGVESSTGGVNIVGSTAYATTLTSNGPIQLSTNNGASVQATLDSTGLGIGTSSPAYKLDVVGAAGYNAYIYDSPTTGGVLIGGSSTRGLITSNSGTKGLALQINGVTALDIDTSGNLGLGVTPSADDLGGKNLEIGFAGNMIKGYQAANFIMLNNGYYNSGWKYANTAAVAYYQQSGGSHIWQNAPSGTAGNAITFTQAMTLDTSGNLGIGTSSPAARLSVIAASANSTAATIGGIEYGGSKRGLSIKTFQSAGGDDCGVEFNAADGLAGYGAFKFSAHTTTLATLDSAGNLGLGVAPSASWLGKAFEINGVGNAIWSPNAINDIRVVSNTKYNAGVQYAANGYANGYYCGGTNGTHNWYNAPSGTAGDPITFTQAMTLTADGNLGVGVTSPGARVDVRGSATDFAGLNVINSESSSGVQTTASIRLGITNSIGVRNTRITAIEDNTDSNSVNLAFFTNEANALNSEVERARMRVQ